MKAKTYLIIQVVLMYLAHLPIYVGLVMLKLPISDNIIDKCVPILLLVGFVLTILILPFSLVCLIMSIVGSFKGKNNPTKSTMIIKIILIPWFVINFFFCVLIFAGFLNPWMMLLAPVVAFILICITYIFMLSTSIFDITFVINCLIRKKIEVNAFFVIAIIMLFTFFLDVVASILLYLKTKKIYIKKQQRNNG